MAREAWRPRRERHITAGLRVARIHHEGCDGQVSVTWPMQRRLARDDSITNRDVPDQSLVFRPNLSVGLPTRATRR